jgi:hypothetical protein
MRKRMQIDNLNELPKEKRPSDYMIWYGIAEDIDDWLEKVLDNKKNYPDSVEMNLSEIET